jgi:cysteinyl-tRNA synthetase
LTARLERETTEQDGHNEAFDVRVDEEATAFQRALGDDLNISEALGAVFRLVRETHVALDRNELPCGSRERLAGALGRLDGVLALLERPETAVDEEIEALIRRRDEARAGKDFAEADRIRDDLAGRGILLEDTPGGTIWKRRLG